LTLLRSLLAVPIGFVLFVAAIRLIPTPPDTYPTNYLLLNLMCTISAAILCGYLTALIAGRYELPHAATLGVVMVMVGFFAMHQAAARSPGWPEMAIAGCGPIAAMMGGALRVLTKRRAKQKT
jgi:hypothetical protein